MNERQQIRPAAASMMFLAYVAMARTVSVSAQRNSSASAGCRICAPPGSELRPGAVPPPPPADLAPRIAAASSNDESTTCGQWQSYAAGDVPEGFGPRCFDLQRWLVRHCCGGLAPPHVCQERVLDRLFGPPDGGSGGGSLLTAAQHRRSVAPVPEYGSPVVVQVSAVVTDIAIVNYGVGGGSLEVGLSLRLAWTDGRLTWDPAEAGGCTEVLVRASDRDEPGASDIWVPGRHASIDSGARVGGSAPATVAGDGAVTWDRALRVNARCETLSGGSKLCKFAFLSDSEERWDRGIVEYAIADVWGSHGSGGVVLEDPFSVPGYQINEVLTALYIQQAEGGQETLALHIHLDPLDDKCSICGIPNASLRENMVPTSDNVGAGGWNHLFEGKQEGWTCRQLNNYLSTLDTDSSFFSKCRLGRAIFTQPCCDGVPSQSECDANIHNLKVDSLENTVSPPDPSLDSDMLKVQVDIDFSHILGIDMQANTMQALVSLELLWIDERLAWDPFIGGCHMVSFRASLDAEQTEIWVPEVDLLNKVEGTASLPSSLASVYSNGAVWWKRTGVLTVACDLTGIDMFPFDVLECALDFGVARDSLFHRVRYTPGNVEFSDRMVERVAKHQEYQVDPRRTNITVESEVMSAHSSEFVRFKFYFDRALEYYVWMFVLLYIIFTYMSFGMFFLDRQVGERLGFGTGILFVIAAQDITMLELTPVTPVVLWIYRFSFGSKLFVIFGIIESLVILYLYFHNDLDGDGVADNPEERESLMSVTLETDIGGNGRLDGCDAGRDGGNNQVDGTDPDDRYTWTRRCNKHQNNCIVFVQRKILKYRINPNDSAMKRMIKRLRLVDRTTALLSFFAYTIFCTVMLCLGASSRTYECSDCFCGISWNETTTSGKACPNGYLDCNTIDTAGEQCFAGIV